VFPKRRVTRTADRTERQTHSSFASVALDLKPAEAALDTSTMLETAALGAIAFHPHRQALSLAGRLPVPLPWRAGEADSAFILAARMRPPKLLRGNLVLAITELQRVFSDDAKSVAVEQLMFVFSHRNRVLQFTPLPLRFQPAAGSSECFCIE